MKRNACILFGLFLLLVSCGESPRDISVNREIDLLWQLDRLDTDRLIYPMPKYIYPISKQIGDTRYWGIFQHPPSAIPFEDLYLGRNAILSFGFGVFDEVWDGPGDGVRFEITVRFAGKKERTVFSRYINPKKNPNHRRWFFEKVPLNNKKPAMATVVLKTYPSEVGKPQNGTHDQAVWAFPKVVSGGVEKSVSPRDKSKPNIVLITLDTVRADYLGCYGNQWMQTPHVDRLAREGVLFERAYAPMSTTTPSHASILTSLMPYKHEVIANDWRLAGAIPQLPQILNEEGYATGAAVSVFHLNKTSGLDKWFDEYEEINLHWRQQGIKDVYTLTRNADTTTSVAVNFMEEHRDSPFFYWVHYYDAHSPYQAVGEFHQKYYEGNPKTAPGETPFIETVPMFRYWSYDDKTWMRPFKDLAYFKTEYGGEISFVDRYIGKIRETLERLELDENTILVITADHGEHLGEHDIYFDHWTLYEEDIHVPLIFWYPGRVPADTRVDTPVSLIDIAPTLLNLVGKEDNLLAKECFEGRQLNQHWQNPGKSKTDRIIPFHGVYYMQIGGMDERYKVIWELRRFKYHDAVQLFPDRVWVYDLQADPGEEDPAAGFYWGPREPGEDPWRDVRGDPPMEMSPKELQAEMDAAKERARKKSLPTAERLKEILAANDRYDFVKPAYANDPAFYSRIVSILGEIKAQVNPVPIQESLKNIFDLATLRDLDTQSVRITDPRIQEYLESLNYNAN